MSLDKIRVGSSIRIEGIESIFKERKDQVKVSYENDCKDPECKHLESLSNLKEFGGIKIEQDLLNFFGDEQKINAVLRQVMELDKTLHLKA